MKVSLGQIAYEAYADQLALLDDWSGLPGSVRSAWIFAGGAVYEELQKRRDDRQGNRVSPAGEPACPVVENPTAIGRPDAVPVVQLPPGAAELIRIDCKDCGHSAMSHQDPFGDGCISREGRTWCSCRLTPDQVRSGATA